MSRPGKISRTIFMRELKLATRQGGGAMMGALFFFLIVAIMPFAIGPDKVTLARIGPAILWIGAILATLLGLDRLFQADHEDGTLELFILSGEPLEVIALLKVLSHWLTTGLPLVLLSPILSLMMDMSPRTIAITMITLAIGTPALTMLGAIGASITVTLKRGGLLTPIIILPFSIPLVIFALGAINAFDDAQVPVSVPLSMLAGLSLFIIALAPFAIAAALNTAQE